MQGRLFDEVELPTSEAPAAEIKKTVSVPSHERKKGIRKKLPEWLPRVEVVHDLPQEKKVLPDGTELVKIGEVVSEKLDIIPAKFQVIKNIRYKYARPDAGAQNMSQTEIDEAAKNTGDSSGPNTALGFIGQLYKIEEQAREQKLSHKKIQKLRQEKARPVLDSFRSWLDGRVNHIAPKSLFGKAINYVLN